ncbi:MAG: IS6 family transposase [Shimia sp.]|uniref:IS6 family transposase n=1 Tax=Shimia sp. TaxID=1954381 RepID=UPI003B8E30AE
MPKKSPFLYFKTSPEITRLAVMLCVRFPRLFRNEEDLLQERGVDENHEAVRYLWYRLGPSFASEISKHRIRGTKPIRWRRNLNDVLVGKNSERHYLRCVVDHEGEVLGSYVARKRGKKVTLKFLRKAMRKYGQPEVIVTDRLKSYGVAMKELGNAHKQKTSRWLNNRVESSHLPFRRRERAMLCFRRMRSLRTFAAVHASVYNVFNSERSLYSRSKFKLNRAASLSEWRSLCAG